MAEALHRTPAPLHRTPAPLPERLQRKRHRLSRLLDRLADQLRQADLTLNNNHYQPCLMLDTVYLPTPALAVKCEPQETPLDLSIKPEPAGDGRESPPQIVPQQLPPPRVPLTEKSTAVERTVVEQNGGELGYVCSACGQMFSLHDRLAKHVASRHRSRKSSESNRAYECGVCSRRFARSDMLTRHARLHSGLKPYTCGSCGQVFSRSDHLATHQRTHTGEKPYKCPLCPYAACRRDMITRHMRTHARIPNLPQTSAASIFSS